MRMKGNGDPLVCAQNLMSFVRGEVPFDRLRGRDPAMLSRPLGTKQAIRNAQMVLELYEPRLDSSVVKSGYVDDQGNFVIDLAVSDRKEGD